MDTGAQSERLVENKEPVVPTGLVGTAAPANFLIHTEPRADAVFRAWDNTGPSFRCSQLTWPEEEYFQSWVLGLQEEKVILGLGFPKVANLGNIC